MKSAKGQYGRLASYSVTISPEDTGESVAGTLLHFTVGAAATEFTLTTNVTAGVKVKITQGTGTLSLCLPPVVPRFVAASLTPRRT